MGLTLFILFKAIQFTRQVNRPCGPISFKTAWCFFIFYRLHGEKMCIEQHQASNSQKVVRVKLIVIVTINFTLTTFCEIDAISCSYVTILYINFVLFCIVLFFLCMLIFYFDFLFRLSIIFVVVVEVFCFVLFFFCFAFSFLYFFLISPL